MAMAPVVRRPSKIWTVLLVITVVVLAGMLLASVSAGRRKTKKLDDLERQMAEMEKPPAACNATGEVKKTTAVAPAAPLPAAPVAPISPKPPATPADATSDTITIRPDHTATVIKETRKLVDDMIDGGIDVAEVTIRTGGSPVPMARPDGTPSKAKQDAKAHWETMERVAQEELRNARWQAIQYGPDDYTAQAARQKADRAREAADEAKREYDQTK